MNLRELRLRALMADNDFRHAARIGVEPREILRLWRRKEYWDARVYLEQRALEQGKDFDFCRELHAWSRARIAA